MSSSYIFYRVFLAVAAQLIIPIAIFIIGVVFIVKHVKNKEASEQKEYEKRKKRLEVEHRNERQHQIQFQKYTKYLAPSSNYAWQQLHLDNKNALGLSNINRDWSYMYVDRNNYKISFPESQYGNKKQYYLLNIDFTPKYTYSEQTYGNGDINAQSNGNATSTGIIHSYNSFDEHNQITGNINIQGKGIISKNEQPTTALLTLAPIDLSRSFRINISGMTSHQIHFLKEYFVLGQLERQRLGIK